MGFRHLLMRLVIPAIETNSRHRFDRQERILVDLLAKNDFVENMPRPCLKTKATISPPLQNFHLHNPARHLIYLLQDLIESCHLEKNFLFGYETFRYFRYPSHILSLSWPR